jgi:ribosomal-protein-alanine N-acetyltransferase
MAFFRIGRSSEPAPTVRGDGLYLRPAESGDYFAWRNVREQSREFLVPWEPTWPSDDLTRGAFSRRLRRQAEEMSRDEAYPFLIFREGDHALIGGITIGGIRRGVAQTATFGYWMGAAYARRGYMTRAVAAAVGLSFSNLRLHRLEAACIPTNIASARLLERNGFRREGLARAYLRINGEWRDHLLFALVDTDVAPRAGLFSEPRIG